MVIVSNGTDKLEIVKHSNGSFSVEREGKYRTMPFTVSHLPLIYEQAKKDISSIETFIDTLVSTGTAPTSASISNDDRLRTTLSHLIDFMSEFQFSPSYRFVNTLTHKAVETDGLAKAKEYVANYFKLTDSPFAKEVEKKLASREFEIIIKTLHDYASPSKNINSRLRIYYGAQGTGKTTLASSEVEYTIVCNSSMQPCDLIEDFTFDDGKATFHPSALVRCMEQGKPVMLDEINLLPYDCLRFLQTITDGKGEFEWKGNTIHIADGFTIIGTMNLTVNGVTFGLPEPLIDRCSDMREFTLTADALLGAI